MGFSSGVKKFFHQASQTITRAPQVVAQVAGAAAGTVVAVPACSITGGLAAAAPALQSVTSTLAANPALAGLAGNALGIPGLGGLFSGQGGGGGGVIPDTASGLPAAPAGGLPGWVKWGGGIVLGLVVLAFALRKHKSE